MKSLAPQLYGIRTQMDQSGTNISLCPQLQNLPVPTEYSETLSTGQYGDVAAVVVLLPFIAFVGLQRRIHNGTLEHDLEH